MLSSKYSITILISVLLPLIHSVNWSLLYHIPIPDLFQTTPLVIAFFLSLGIINIHYECRYNSEINNIHRFLLLLLKIPITVFLVFLVIRSGSVKPYSNANYGLVFWTLTYIPMIIFIVQEAQFAWQKGEKTKSDFNNAQVEFELTQLRQQIDPHFLFNSLNTLRAMVLEANENTEKYILSLAKFYHQLLGSSKLAIVTLKEELAFLKSYTHLLETRFEDSFQLEIEITQEAEKQKIPVFSLQILIENCLKHNRLSSTNPLNIKIFQSCANTVTVANEFRPLSSKTTSNYIGLQNLAKRYSLLKIHEGVKITQTEDSFAVTIKLMNV